MYAATASGVIAARVRPMTMTPPSGPKGRYSLAEQLRGPGASSHRPGDRRQLECRVGEDRAGDAPAICAAMYPTALRRVCAFIATMQSVTAGFRCARDWPEDEEDGDQRAAGRQRVGQARHGAIPGERCCRLRASSTST